MDIQKKTQEIKNLNATIQKQAIKYKELQQYIDKILLNSIAQQLEIKRLNTKIEELEFNHSELKYDFDLLTEEFGTVNEEFNDYQTIKKFEYIKRLLKKHVDTSDQKQVEFFMMQGKNKALLSNIMGIDEDYFKVYTTIRLRRNRLSHWYY